MSKSTVLCLVRASRARDIGLSAVSNERIARGVTNAFLKLCQRQRDSPNFPHGALVSKRRADRRRRRRRRRRYEEVRCFGNLCDSVVVDYAARNGSNNPLFGDNDTQIWGNVNMVCDGTGRLVDKLTAYIQESVLGVPVTRNSKAHDPVNVEHWLSPNLSTNCAGHGTDNWRMKGYGTDNLGATRTEAHAWQSKTCP
jgi:hypothetical protein